MFKDLLLLILITFFFSCKKENDDLYGLPKATQTGENTIGCVINGSSWQTDGVDYGHLIYPTYDEDGTTYLGENGFRFYARYCFGFGPESFCESFDIKLKPVRETKKYDFENIESFNIEFHKNVPSYNNTAEKYFLDTLSNSYVEVSKLDTITNIFSAKFEFTLIHQDNLDTLIIKNGRFDVNYTQ